MGGKIRLDYRDGNQHFQGFKSVILRDAREIKKKKILFVNKIV